MGPDRFRLAFRIFGVAWIALGLIILASNLPALIALDFSAYSAGRLAYFFLNYLLRPLLLAGVGLLTFLQARHDVIDTRRMALLAVVLLAATALTMGIGLVFGYGVSLVSWLLSLVLPALFLLVAVVAGRQA